MVPSSEPEQPPRPSKASLPDEIDPAAKNRRKRGGAQSFVPLEETKILNTAIDRFDDIEKIAPKDHFQFPLLVVTAVFLVSLAVGAIVFFERPTSAKPNLTVSAPSQELNTNQEALAEDESPPSSLSTNEVFLKTYESDINQARDAVWAFILDPLADPPWVDVTWDTERKRHFEAFFSDPSHRIRTLTLNFVGGRVKDDVFDLGFNARSEVNPEGSLVEVRTGTDGRSSIDWVKFAQHHFRTFPQFYRQKPKGDSKTFYLSVSRKHAFSDTAFPSGRATERFMISGTNPIHWVPAYVIEGSLEHRTLLDAAGWGKVGQIRATLEWRTQDDGDQPFLHITDIVATNWQSEATR